MIKLKYLIPFTDKMNYKSNDQCSICKQIDELTNHILQQQSELMTLYKLNRNEKIKSFIQTNIQLINRLETQLVDGYGIISTLEKIGLVKEEFFYLKNTDSAVLNRFQSYVNLFQDYNINYSSINNLIEDNLIENTAYNDIPLTLYSRWCKKCGSRKLDIYDTDIDERKDLQPITNFFCNLISKDNKYSVSVTWTDSIHSAVNYSGLYINNKLIDKFNINEHKSNSFQVEIENNILYTFYIADYDEFDNEIVRSQNKIILHTDTVNEIIKPITDLKINQETILIYDKLNQHWIRKNALVANFTPTTDKTILKRSLNMDHYNDSDNDLYNDSYNETYNISQNNVYNSIHQQPNEYSSPFNGTVTNISEGLDFTFLSTDNNIYIDNKNNVYNEQNIYIDFNKNYDHENNKYYFNKPNKIYQIVDDNDLRTWIIKPYPVSKLYARIYKNQFQFYNNINYDSPAVFFSLHPLGTDCSNFRFKNFSKRAEVTWIDASVNRSKTVLYLKEYDGKPILNINDAELIYETTEFNKHNINPYTIYNLKNGTDYQLGIFSVTKDNITIINTNQLKLSPRYIRPKHIINEEFINKYNINIFKEPINKDLTKINIDPDLNEINNESSYKDEYGNSSLYNNFSYINNGNSIDRSIYNYQNRMNIGKFYWNEDKLTTNEETILWFETKYPVLEGGKLNFDIYSNYPCQLNVYSNNFNIFKQKINSINTFKWEHININIEPMNYCKIIIEIKCKYLAFYAHIKNIEFIYNMSQIK